MDLVALKRELREYVARFPADAGEILRVVSDALSDYERAQERLRSALADKALLGLMEPARIAQLPVARTIDAMRHQFPTGATGRGCAIVEIECWRAFVERCCVEGVDEEWIESTRGEECLRWYREVVRPEVEVAE